MLQGRSHRADFQVKRGKTTCYQGPSLHPPKCNKKKKILLLVQRKKTKQNRTSNRRKQEGMKGKGETRRGKCNFNNVILTVKKHARNSPGRENKTKNPRTAQLALFP